MQQHKFAILMKPLYALNGPFPKYLLRYNFDKVLNLVECFQINTADCLSQYHPIYS